MFALLKEWFQRYFSEPEAAILLIVLVLGFGFLLLVGNLFLPLIVALVFAYMLDIVVRFLHRCLKIPRWLGVTVVYTLFLVLFVVVIFGAFPFLSSQIGQFIDELPNMLDKLHKVLMALPAKYPHYISQDSVNDMISATTFSSDKVASLGKLIVSYSLTTIPAIVSWLVYLFLVPLLVLFYLKDKTQLLAWTKNYVPERRSLLMEVLNETKQQLGNYLRGKVVEIIIVGVVTYIGFWFFNLNYAFLLASLVGLSVLIPYVGMVLVTIPIVIIGVAQFGFAPELAYMLLIYLIIQGLDGNVLVPLLFSEAVNLHPVAIIAAVLFFGGIWGFWGLFFAIPLATLVKAVINGWYRHAQRSQAH